eukprot:325466-Pyramimonas_sp.AAC.1
MVATRPAAAHRAFSAKVAEVNLHVSKRRTEALATSTAPKIDLMQRQGRGLNYADFADAHRDHGGDAADASYTGAP